MQCSPLPLYHTGYLELHNAVLPIAPVPHWVPGASQCSAPHCPCTTLGTWNFTMQCSPLPLYHTGYLELHNAVLPIAPVPHWVPGASQCSAPHCPCTTLGTWSFTMQCSPLPLYYTGYLELHNAVLPIAPVLHWVPHWVPGASQCSAPHCPCTTLGTRSFKMQCSPLPLYHTGYHTGYQELQNAVLPIAPVSHWVPGASQCSAPHCPCTTLGTTLGTRSFRMQCSPLPLYHTGYLELQNAVLMSWDKKCT